MGNFFRVVFLSLLILVQSFPEAFTQGTFDPSNSSPNIGLTNSNTTATETGIVAFIPTANDVTANWQTAGLVSIGGIPNRTTQCGITVTTSGVTPPGTGDDFSKITAAIAACPAGQFVQLGSGTFQLDAGQAIVIHTGITLRGTGVCNGVSLGANPQSTGGPFCATVIQHYNGTWPVQNGPQCGSTTGTPPSGTAPGTLGSCPAEFCGIICIQPASGALTNFGWGGCLLNGDDPTTKGCGSLIAANMAKGDTTIQVASTSNFSVGMVVMIDERPFYVSTANPTGNGNANISATSDFLSTSSTPVTARLARPDSGCDSNYGLCSTAAGTDRFNHELHFISAIGSGPCPGTNCTLTFDTPVTITFRSGAFDGRVYWPQANGTNTAFLQQAGVENLTISRSVNNPVAMMFCAYCWIKNVETAYWADGLNINFSARSELVHSFLHDCADCANDGREYPVSLGAATTELLMHDNIVLFGGKGMVGRAASASVVAYNYVDWQRYQPNTASNGFGDMGVNGSHEIGSHHILFEGNRGSNCDNDNTHGNLFYLTYFRNHCAGLRADFADAHTCGNVVSDTNGVGWNASCVMTSGNGPLRPFGPMSFNYWIAYIANVGGLAGVSTTAHGWVYFRCANGACGASSEANKSIYLSGWSNPDWKFGDLNLDGSNGPAFLFKNGNYDYVTAGIPSGENPPSGYASPSVSSLYLAAAPPYFTGASCTYPWPPVTPSAGTQLPLNSCGGPGIPALARWAAGTPFVTP